MDEWINKLLDKLIGEKWRAWHMDVVSLVVLHAAGICTAVFADPAYLRAMGVVWAVAWIVPWPFVINEKRRSYRRHRSQVVVAKIWEALPAYPLIPTARRWDWNALYAEIHYTPATDDIPKVVGSGGLCCAEHGSRIVLQATDGNWFVQPCSKCKVHESLENIGEVWRRVVGTFREHVHGELKRVLGKDPYADRIP